MNPETSLTNCKVFGKNPDITFVFPNNGGATLRTERYKLIQKSEVFQKQFTSSSFKAEDRIIITDIFFDTFCELVAHIYGQNVYVNEVTVLELLYATKKYFINDLTFYVIKTITRFIDDGRINIVTHFNFINQFEIKILDDYMKGTIQKSPLTIIKQLTLSKPHKRLLEIILESTSFSISEFELYTAIVDMLKRNYEGKLYSEEDLRKEMGRMIYLIRFPTMTVRELVSCAKKPSLLNERQLLDFLLYVQERIYTDTLQFYSVVSRTKTPEPIEKALILSRSPPIYTIQQQLPILSLEYGGMGEMNPHQN
ncbi:BTB/POZ domain-containing protein 6-like [Lutzomyia longipalpis]|uniref:BTB/POZ domain-containing protein 6-like n=1 Tax=Lutzomyia longipalpis TaxID=7200 RepID=UPI002483CD52|nr:BTB/POZ domain-containing protein 6-like [Lutzomyia longipalpis]